MNSSWKDLYETRLTYRKKVSHKIKLIDENYNKIIEEIKKEKNEKIKEIQEDLDIELNPKKYDLEINPYVLFAELGFEIGKKIRVKKYNKKELEDYYSDFFKEHIDEEDYIMNFKITDNIMGTYDFVEEKTGGKVFSASLNHYFEIIEVLEKFDKVGDVPFKE